MKRFYFALILLNVTCKLTAQNIHIIPEPVKIVEKAGVFHFDTFTKIYLETSDSSATKTVKQFTNEFAKCSGIQLQLKGSITNHAKNSIIISIAKDEKIKKEGYILDINPEQLHIAAYDEAGLFYAFQSIRQLFSSSFYKSKNLNTSTQWNIPAVYILDYPRYSYRGMLLDVSRHFFSASFIKQYLDILASYKLNTFHWHLTDSHGWRLEIKQYPRLTSVGAWRANRNGIPMTIAEATRPGESATYGGYYTQEQVKEIIKYAKERFITIIPEIEMPGHCEAALVAYPQYNDKENKTPLLLPCGYPGDLKHNFCVAWDSTYIFLQNILKEVIQIFPSEYIHIGGDEVRGEPWLHCSRCQKLMRDKNFTTAKQLQAYFTKRIDSFLNANGKKIIGWDEILWADVSHQSVAMAWHSSESAIDDIKKGYDVVMAPYHYTYFDFYQSPPNLEPYITYAQLLMDTVYAFDPAALQLSSEEAKHVLGGEACLWTENVATPERVEYMMLPRLLALSEVLWSQPENKNKAGFINKVEEQFKRFDAEKINYAKSIYNVTITPSFDTTTKTISITLADETHKYPIHYTTDGSLPTAKSALYTNALNVNKSIHIKTAGFKSGKRTGKINEDSFAIHQATGAAINITPGDSTQRDACNKLVDGIYGTVEPFDGRWVSFHDSVITIIIDLQKIKIIHSVKLQCMEDQVGNIFLPKSIEVSLSSDSVNYIKYYSVFNKKIPEQLLRHIKYFEGKKPIQKVRFIKIIFKNTVSLKNNPNENLLLIDEIVVQ
ncbi:MAG: family 20 glycosylhydrolase [Ginsengibacter sp.]